MFKFGSKRDLRADTFKCTVRLLNENEVLDEVEFNVSTNGYIKQEVEHVITSFPSFLPFSGKQKDRSCWTESSTISTLLSLITLAFNLQMTTAKRLGLIPSGLL